MRALLLIIAGLCLFFSFLRPLDWNGTLQRQAASADRVVIERINGGPKVLESVEVIGRGRVRELLAAIQIDPSESGKICACRGDELIHFYNGSDHLLTLSHHHGKSLRWPDGPWTADGALTADSQLSLPAWFRNNGYKSASQTTTPINGLMQP